MGKRGGNHPVPGYFTVQGGEVEDRDIARMNKQALVRDTARVKRRAGRKGKLGAAPKAQRTKEPPMAGSRPTAKVLERAHDREFARMNERTQKAPKRVKPAAAGAEQRASRSRQPAYLSEQPAYLTDAARGLLRRVARYAMAPVAIARAVVDRLRDRD